MPATTLIFPLSFAETLIIGSIFGLIIGSFLSMLTWRLPRILIRRYEYELQSTNEQLESPEEESNAAAQTVDRANEKSSEEKFHPNESILKQISLGGSYCPSCHNQLKWFQLIPLFSWLWGRGKCMHCQAPISARYPIIEFTTAATTILILWQFGFSDIGLAALLLNYLLITICVIDFEHQLILDNLSLPLLWIGLLINTSGGFVSLELAVWGAVIGYMILWLVYHGFKLLTGKEGMGYGDFKLLAALGAWFGALALPQIILIAAVSSIIIGFIGIALKLRSYDQPLAFGPFLALGGWATLFLGSSIFQ